MTGGDGEESASDVFAATFFGEDFLEPDSLETSGHHVYATEQIQQT